MAFRGAMAKQTEKPWTENGKLHGNRNDVEGLQGFLTSA